MRKFAALLLSAALLAGSAAAAGPEEAFPAKYSYPGYPDVAQDAWYARDARVCYEVGLMMGTGSGFAPDQSLTVGELAAVAARINEAVTGEKIPAAVPGQPWYQRYADCLTALGMEVPEPTRAATRQEFAALLSLPAIREEAETYLSPINTLPNRLPDIDDSRVLDFYRAGILTGTDSFGTFAGDRTLTRAEAAAMTARLVRPELRKHFTLSDYGPFAAGLAPSDVMFTNGTTAGQYLPYVQGLILGLEEDCAAQGLEFNWFNTVDGVTFLDYVKATALERFGVTRAQGTRLYQDFDVQVFYSRLIDWNGGLLDGKKLKTFRNNKL